MSAEQAELLPPVVYGLDEYQFSGNSDTVLRKRQFIEALHTHGSISHAALAARVSRKTVYRWLDADPAFLEAIEDSKENVADNVETSLYRKAIDGDTVSMIFWLKAHRPKYRDRLQVDTAQIDEELSERLKRVSQGGSSSSNPALALHPPPAQKEQD